MEILSTRKALVRLLGVIQGWDGDLSGGPEADENTAPMRAVVESLKGCGLLDEDFHLTSEAKALLPWMRVERIESIEDAIKFCREGRLLTVAHAVLVGARALRVAEAFTRKMEAQSLQIESSAPWELEAWPVEGRVYCKVCNKNHSVEAGEAPCGGPGSWIPDPS